MSEPREQIETWFDEELNILIAKGATPALFQEPAFQELVAENVVEKHMVDATNDPELMEYWFTTAFKAATAEDLKELAREMRAHGDTALAEQVEIEAESREEFSN